MKTTIIVSVMLLFAFAVYGVINYRQQKHLGKLDQLYKDDKYNRTQQENKPASETEKWKALATEIAVDTTKNTARPKKVINAKAFSRAALDIEEEGLTVDEIHPQNGAKAVVRSANKRSNKEENINAAVQHDRSVVAIADEVKIMSSEKAATDSVQADNNEKEFVRVSEFSRAPIRKKGDKRTAKKH